MSVYSPTGCHSRAGVIAGFVSIGAPTLVAMARLSSREVAQTAAMKARQLAALGISAGDRVAVAIPPGLEFAALLHAMPLLGSVLVPLNTRDPGHIPEHDLLVDQPLTGPEVDVEPLTSPEADVGPRAPQPGDTWV